MSFFRPYYMLASILMLFTPLAVLAEEIPAGVSIITAPEVRSMAKDKHILLVNTLSHIEFQMQHISGSINIPVDEVKKSSLMPKDKSAPIIFYCNGTACPYSKRASIAAVGMGYSKVYWFRGGILEWRKFQYPMEVDKVLSKIKVHKLSPKEFREKTKENVLVLDVRPNWWRQSKEQAGVVAGTQVMIPLLKLDQQLHLLPKDKPILITDRLMRQSVHAAKYLVMKGFNIAGVLKGGSKRWVAEGLPVMKKQNEPRIAGGV